jgi:hypothetical protein
VQSARSGGFNRHGLPSAAKRQLKFLTPGSSSFQTPKASHRIAGGRARFLRVAPGFRNLNVLHPEGVH